MIVHDCEDLAALGQHDVAKCCPLCHDGHDKSHHPPPNYRVVLAPGAARRFEMCCGVDQGAVDWDAAFRNAPTLEGEPWSTVTLFLSEGADGREDLICIRDDEGLGNLPGVKDIFPLVAPDSGSVVMCEEMAEAVVRSFGVKVRRVSYRLVSEYHLHPEQVDPDPGESAQDAMARERDHVDG